MDSKNTENQLRSSLIDIAVEAWRLEKTINKLIETQDASKQTKYMGKIRWFQKRVLKALEEADCCLCNLEGLSYDSGMAVTPINIDDFRQDDQLMIDQMIEPVIVNKQGKLLHTGIVSLTKLQS